MAMPQSQSQQQIYKVFKDGVLFINPNLSPSFTQGQDLYFQGNALSQVGANVVQEITGMANNIFPTSSGGLFLDKHASNLGMTPRMGALPALGEAKLVEGTGAKSGGNTIPANTQLTDANGNIYFTLSDITIASGETINGTAFSFQSLKAGSGTEPSELTLTFSPALTLSTNGMPSTVPVSTASISYATAGSDVESDQSLAIRITFFGQNPRGGGSNGDYRRWCFLGSPEVTQADVITTPQSNEDILFPIILSGNPNPNYYIDGSTNNGYTETAYPISRSAVPETLAAVQNYTDSVCPLNANPNTVTVSTYLFSSAVSSTQGDPGTFALNVVLSDGLTLNTLLSVPPNASNINPGISVQNLIARELRRAIISTPLGGVRPFIGGSNYILVSTLEDVIMQGLANTSSQQGNYASVIVSLEILYYPGNTPTVTSPYVPVPSLITDGTNGVPNLFINGAAKSVYMVYDIDVTDTTTLTINPITSI